MTLQSFSFVLIDQLLKGAAILLPASLAGLAFQRASAAKRNALWLSALAALLLLPLTYLAQPQWLWAPIKSPSMSKRTTLLLGDSLQTPLAGRAEAHSWDLPDWKNAFTGLWGAGVALLAARRIAASRRLRWLLRTSEPAPSGPLNSAFSAMAKRCSLTRPARLRLSSACRAPITWGIFRPIVLLPKEAEYWSRERLGIVFGHELGHILRWDAATRLLAQAVCAMHWFNPLVWMAARQLRLTQEQACDNLVLLQGADPATYATALVESARCFQWSGFGQALTMAQPSTLETRVEAIMDARLTRDGIGALPILVGVTAVGFTLLASALAQVSPPRNEPPLQPLPVPSSAAPALPSPEPQTSLAPLPPVTPKEPDVPVSKTTAAESPSAAKAVQNPQAPAENGIFRSDKPIHITAEFKVIEAGVIAATGSVVFEHNGVMIKADAIRYLTETRIVRAQGDVNVVQGTNVLEAEDLELDLTTGLYKVTGPSRTLIPE